MLGFSDITENKKISLSLTNKQSAEFLPKIYQKMKAADAVTH